MRTKPCMKLHKLMALFLFLCAMLAVCSLSGCTLPWGSSGGGGDTYDTGFVPDQPGIYDSADRAVFIKYDKKEQTLSFQSLQNDKRYTLGITGSTYFYDKYGVAVTADGLKPGVIVDLTFYKPRRRLNTLQISPTAWVIENSGNFQIKEKTGMMTVGKDSYKLAGGLCVLSGEEEKELMDIASIDSLNIYGVDNEVYSISVTRGHGYLRLTGDEYFYGGWIEVGEKLIQKISENMLLTVPEGKSTVLISHKGISGTYSISVDRGQEVTLDIGSMKEEQAASGEVVFTLTPSTATLYIDGTKADASRPIRMEYGIHQLIARAEGYETLTQYLRVGSPTAGIDVTLQEITTGDQGDGTTQDPSLTTAGPAVDDGDVSGGDPWGESGTTTITTVTEGGETDDAEMSEEDMAAAASTTGVYYVVISAPNGAEAYFDGNFVGMVPCRYAKKEGTHVITIRKSGYTTRSYTVQIDGEKEDIVYSFPDLIATE
ncbi:MAG: PEGA domain-containing protein [Lachnospiraceae bacterium]|nr:PEGA domain-containing protein [Lachnospiraceae bacterium]